MSGRIDLNPWALKPPDNPEEFKSRPLAAVLEGPFPSYFAGRSIPQKPKPEGEDTLAIRPAPKSPPSAAVPTGEFSQEGTVIKSGSTGKIFVIGTSAILKNNVIDEQGRSINATFLLNVLDDLNGRDEYAAMRSKLQQFNPLRSVSGGARTLVKTFNVAGLPVIVVVFGILVWVRRAARKKSIKGMFAK
jgi:ABC-2 type transport system permease protein